MPLDVDGACQLVPWLDDNQSQVWGPQRWLPATTLSLRFTSPLLPPVSWGRQLSCWEHSHTHMLLPLTRPLQQDKLLKVKLQGQKLRKLLRQTAKLPSRRFYQPAVWASFSPRCEGSKGLSSCVKGVPWSCAFNGLEPTRGTLLRFFFSLRDLCLPSSCGFWHQRASFQPNCAKKASKWDKLIEKVFLSDFLHRCAVSVWPALTFFVCGLFM